MRNPSVKRAQTVQAFVPLSQPRITLHAPFTQRPTTSWERYLDLEPVSPKEKGYKMFEDQYG